MEFFVYQLCWDIAYIIETHTMPLWSFQQESLTNIAISCNKNLRYFDIIHSQQTVTLKVKSTRSNADVLLKFKTYSHRLII